MSELLQLGSVESRPKRPNGDELTLRFSERAIAELEALKPHYPTVKACILPALWIAQREYDGFLSPEAMAEVAHRLGRSYAEIQGVATFYTMYHTVHAPGKHLLEVCTCLTCHVNGAYRVRDLIRQKLGIGHGETTADGMFSVEEVECLNACDRAPVMMVGDAYHGPVDEPYLDGLIEKLRNTKESTVVKLADEIVQAHLAKPERPKNKVSR